MLKKILTFLLLATMLLFAASCKKQSGDLTEVRIAFFPNITHAQALYGKHTELYQQAFGDLKVKWLQFNAGPAEIEAMFAGEVDIGYIGPVPAINAFLRSRGDVRVISGASNAGAVLVTRPNLKLTSPSQLGGLKVAIPQYGNTQHISLLHILRQNGLETKTKGGTVEVVQAENADIRTLLDRGSIDAALVPEPWGARMIHEIGANLFLDEAQVWRNGDYPVALVIVRMDFLKQHPDVVETFLQTHLKITKQINADIAAAREIINNELIALTGRSLAPEVLEEALSRVKITTDIDSDVLNEFIVLLAAEGFAASAEPQPGLIHAVKH